MRNASMRIFQFPALSCTLSLPDSSIATGIGLLTNDNCQPSGKTKPSSSSRLLPVAVKSI